MVWGRHRAYRGREGRRESFGRTLSRREPAAGGAISESLISSIYSDEAHGRQSARMILAYHLHALGQHQAAAKLFGEDLGRDPNLGVLDGDAAVLDRIRSRCLQGMSISPSSYSR